MNGNLLILINLIFIIVLYHYLAFADATYYNNAPGWAKPIGVKSKEES